MPEKPAAPDATPQLQNRVFVDHLNGDVKATMTTELISSQVPIDMNIEEPESPVVPCPLATNGAVGQRRSTHECRPSFKIRSALSTYISDEAKLASYQEALQHRYSHE